MRPPLYLPLLTLTIYLFWRGYDYAISDQDEVLPYLMHLLDAGLFHSDWFVNTQLEIFGPRTLFVLIAWLPAKLFGPYATILGIYVASWFGTSTALYTLGLQLTRERLAATVSVILALLLTPKFTLGGNDLATWIFTPSMLAWTLGLWGLVFFMRRRMGRAALLMGISTWMQALVGLQIAMVCALLLLWKHGWTARHPYLFVGSFTLFAFPALGPLIWHQLAGIPPEGLWSYFYILFEFRAPHHYLPMSFSPESALRFATLLGLGAVTFRLLPETHCVLVRRLLIIIASLCAISFLCSEVLHLETITKLQLFKLTVLVKVFCVILISNAAAQLILKFYSRTLTVFFDHGHYALGATVLIAATLAILSPDAMGIWPSSDQTPAEEIASWAHDSTDTNAIFAVPPAWGHFRSQAKRAIVVNFKAVPFHPPYMTEWFTRLTEIAPTALPRRGGAQFIPALDSAFLALPGQEIKQLAARYGFEYIVRQKAETPEGFELVYHAAPWTVWQIKHEP